MLSTPVSEQKKDDFSKTEFYSETEGPDKITLIETPTEAFEIRLEMLKNAEHSVDISYHVIHKGETTDAFFGEVLKAADRGVSVRILLDGKAGAMSFKMKKVLRDMNEHENISFRRYNTAHFLKPWEFHSLFHDKFINVDNRYLLLGGRNIGDKYYDPEDFTDPVVNDRDVFVWNSTLSEDSVIPQVHDYMDYVWQDSKPTKVKDKGTPLIYQYLYSATETFKQNNPKFYQKTLKDYKDRTLSTNKINLIYNPINTTKKEPWVAYQLKELALKAKRSVVLQTPYATGNKHLLNTMSIVSDNVDATMLTNSLASSPNFPAFSNYYSQRKKFVATGVDIYELQSTDSIHGKSIIIDDRLSAVGSLNMDDRSFYIDTETMLVIDSPEFADSLGNAIHNYIDSSLLVGEDNKYIPNENIQPVEVSLVKRMLMWLTSIISRLFEFLI